MAKPKQKPLLASFPGKCRNSNSAGPGVELHEDDSWVIVKKQRVRILIPPLPATNKQCSPRHSEPTQSQAMPTKPSSAEFPFSNPQDIFQKHAQAQPLSLEKTCLEIHSADRIEKPLLLAPKLDIPKLDIPTARRSPRPNPTTKKLHRKYNLVQADYLKCENMLGVRSDSKAIKRSFSFLGGGMFLNQTMRMLILEKKLQRAGGLDSWLASLGLDRYATIFQGEKMGKFQLLNLSMKKLKDMGANAVGPRRKLMHAIDCLCEPSCFRAL